VSEYQYYEFRALDRRLTAEQQRRLRSLSSRADISATRFTNEYSLGDFRGDPGRLLEEYFDAYLYAANWGTRELAFRLPRALLDAEAARRYCDSRDRARRPDRGRPGRNGGRPQQVAARDAVSGMGSFRSEMTPAGSTTSTGSARDFRG
jgi:hypothetical protein